MSKADKFTLDQVRLVKAWQQTLPDTMDTPDQCIVQADESDRNSLRVTIQSAGHQMYSFDFIITYVDSREIRVTLVDVEKSGKSIDERTDIIQELIADYTRHLHECAQALHGLTKV